MQKKNNIYALFFAILAISLLTPACESLPPEITSILPSQATPTERPILFDEIQPTISATGEVVPAEWSSLSMTVAGVVEEVLVAEGDFVEEGQVLVRLKGKEDLEASIASAEYEVASAQKALDDLFENNDDLQMEALQRISEYTIEVQDAQYQLDKRFTMPANQKDLEKMEALDLMKEIRDEVWERYEPYKNRLDTDETKKDLQDELDEAETDYNSAVNRVEYEIALQIAKDNLQEAREDFDLYSEGPDPAELALAEARLKAAKSQLEAAEAALDDLELIAPFSGTVTEVDVNTNEYVGPGKAVILLGDLEHLQVETTDMSEMDTALIEIGDKAQVTFDAFPGLELVGTVSKIAPKASSGSGVNYKVIVLLDEKPGGLRWGMTAFVDIESDGRVAESE